MIDDEIDRYERLDDLRIAPELFHGASHRGEIDDQWNAGKILENNPRDHERNFLVRRRFCIPVRQGLDVLSPNFFPVAIPQDRFEYDPDADCQPRDRADALFFERRQRVAATFAAIPGVEVLERVE